MKFQALFGGAPEEEQYESLASLMRRFPPSTFAPIQRSLRFLLLCADRLFPGFRQLWPEFF